MENIVEKFVKFTIDKIEGDSNGANYYITYWLHMIVDNNEKRAKILKKTFFVPSKETDYILKVDLRDNLQMLANEYECEIFKEQLIELKDIRLI